MAENNDIKKDMNQGQKQQQGGLDKDRDKMGQGGRQGQDKDIGNEEDKVTQRNPRQGGQNPGQGGGQGQQGPR